MKEPYVSQTIESNSCGAHAIAYYLWETNKSQLINDKQFIANLHKKIQIGPNVLGIPENYSNPGKMAKELSDCWHSNACTCMIANSPLSAILKSLNISAEDINVLDKLKNGDNKYAIILTSVGQESKALHYMLVKYENDTFQLMDSLYNMDHSTFRMIDEEYDRVVWETFTPASSGKLILDRVSAHYYVGAGIVIE